MSDDITDVTQPVKGGRAIHVIACQIIFIRQLKFTYQLDK